MFPFTLYPQEVGGPHYGPAAFREIFHSARPHGMTWYTYSVTVKSPTEVEFSVYDMHDLREGGIGNVTAKFAVGVPPKITKSTIELRAVEMAHARRQEELLAQEGEIVRRYADEILAEINHPRPGA